MADTTSDTVEKPVRHAGADPGGSPRAGGTVLLVGQHLSGGEGNRSASEDLADRLRAAGWRTITTSGRTGRWARVVDMVATAWRRRREFDVAQVDVFSGAAFAWAEAVCAVLRRAGKPYVLTLRGGSLPLFAGRHERRVRRLLRSAAAVTTPSRYLLEAMRPYREDVALLPNALGVSAYPFRRRTRVEPSLIWLRAFHRVYNPSLAPEVLHRLRQAGFDARLVMAGPDKGDGSLEEMRRTAQARGVEAHVATPGRLAKPEIPGWLDRADVFLNTTDADNTPVSVMEAMACGLCVVSTDVGGIPYLLEHEHDALLVPPGDADAMTAAVRRLLTEPGLAARLSTNARRKVEGFDWSVVLPEWERLLRVRAGEARRRSG